MPAHRKVARVLFDEAHSEAWTVRPDEARAIQPAHPADSSYCAAASALADREFEVDVNADSPLTPAPLDNANVLGSPPPPPPSSPAPSAAPACPPPPGPSGTPQSATAPPASTPPRSTRSTPSSA